MSWEPWQDEKLTRDWKRNVAIKVLQEDLGKAASTIKERRRKLGLQPRRFIKARRKVSFNVDAATYRAIGKRAVERGQTISNYLRALVQRDLG